MFRLSGLLSLSLAIFCGGLLFWTSQSVQRAEHTLSRVSQNDAGEVEALRVLSAEWDYLNSPDRLEALTKTNLDINKLQVDSKDFIAVNEDVPQPIIPVLPKIKPKFLRQVSTQHNSGEVENKSSVIKKTERNNFNELIENVANDNQLSGGQR